MTGRLAIAWLLALGIASTLAIGAQPAARRDYSRGNRMIADYFRTETAAVAANCLTDISSLDDWLARRESYRRQLREMLGLDPLPERTPLRPVITGRLEQDGFIVEKLHFQSLPGLYVTGNLYLPKGLRAPAPAVLYVCGHSRVVIDNVPYGAKAGYQHHAAWFARHGYVCLVIDTLQLGEIEGIHHGTYRYGRWWWNSRGYTPAGVEAWNAIRALDYLQSRPEVDPHRLGVTGRSGGGAYSWWLAALDERIQVAVPVAGITDLQDHVVEGVVEGHCDCMYLVNTYRWDYPLVAALVAPRPLLIANSDKDRIFPLEGVIRLHEKVRRIYRLYGAADRLGLLITEGPHRDTQDLQLPAFRWFDRFLKRDERLIEAAAVPFFTPQQLKVFARLPEDQRNTRIDEEFVPTAPASPLPVDPAAWSEMRADWLRLLGEKCFRGWPAEPGPLDLQPVWSAERDGLRMMAFDFTSQPAIRLRLYLLHRAQVSRPTSATLYVLSDADWLAWLAAAQTQFARELAAHGDGGGAPLSAPDPEAFRRWQRSLARSTGALAWIAPRGVGTTAWDPDPARQVQIRRRFMLLGQTLAGMQIWDVRRAVHAVRAALGNANLPMALVGRGELACAALYAALFEPRIVRLDLQSPPASHRDGPDLLNVLRVLDLPQVVAMVAGRTRVTLVTGDVDAWAYARSVAERLGWPATQLQIRPVATVSARVSRRRVAAAAADSPARPS